SPLYQVHRVVEQAKGEARRRLLTDDRVSHKSELERIILHRQLTNVFQPIVELKSNAVLGYEALSRGPRETEYESPLVLLRIADRTGLLAELDRAFRAITFDKAKVLPAPCKMFVNTLPATLYDPDMQAGRLSRWLESVD